MSNPRNKVIALITSIRESFSGSEIVYTHGSCYRFYEILKCVFPTAEAYTNGEHIISKIGGIFYNINGRVMDAKNYYRFSSNATRSAKEHFKKHKWAFNFNK